MIQLSAEYWTAVAGLFAIAVVFLYGYRFDVCILNSKHDCFFFYQEYIKRSKTTLLSSFEELTKMGHSIKMICSAER